MILRILVLELSQIKTKIRNIIVVVVVVVVVANTGCPLAYYLRWTPPIFFCGRLP
jgi:hypothetical protein